MKMDGRDSTADYTRKIGILLFDQAGYLYLANPDALQILGIEEITPLYRCSLFTHFALPEQARACLQQGDSFQYALQVSAQTAGSSGLPYYEDGTLQLTVVVTPLLGEASLPFAGYAVQLHQASEGDLLWTRSDELAFERVLANFTDGIIVFDTALRYLLWNTRMEQLTSIPAVEVIGRSIMDIHSHLREPGADTNLQRALAGETVVTPDFPYQSTCGDTCWLSKTYSPNRDARGQVIGAICVVRDITERKEEAERLETLSYEDELTGLYNRRGLMICAKRQIETALRLKLPLVVMFADLDDMKNINDIYGHKGGDQALVEVAGILRRTFRGSDVLARISGDEFVILSMMSATCDSESIVSRLDRTVNIFNEQQRFPIPLSISLGVAQFQPNAPLTLDELLAMADQHMYETKRRRKAVAP